MVYNYINLKINKPAERIELHWLQNNEGECPIPGIKERAKNPKGYLLKDFSNNLEDHNECVSNSIEWRLNDDPKYRNNHTNTCSSCSEHWQLPEDLVNTLDE